MFVRAKRRFKDGKEHRYWSVVENCRNRDGRVVQRQVLYLGEINDSQRAAWCRSIEVLQGDCGPASMALFPDDREAPELHCETVRIHVKELSVHRPRQWGGCWLALTLWDRLELDRFWAPRLSPSRQGTRWLDVLKTQVCYQLLEPGSEWRLHRHWYEHSALGDLLNSPVRVIAGDTLYRCLDKVLEHKRAFFSFLRERWETLFQARFDVLLYDLTSTCFESDPPFSGKRQFGYSRDKRSDCVQVVIALVVTPEGFPLAYEVMPGNNTTLAQFLAKIESQYGRSERVWIMDRGIPTEETLAAMRGGQAPVHYLVGTPKGRLTRLEQSFVGLPWREVRESVEVKLLAQDGELYILAQSRARIFKERAMRRRRLKKLWRRLHELRGQSLSRDELLLKLGAAKKEVGRTYHLVDIRLPQAGKAVTADTLHLRAAPRPAAPGPAPRGPVPAALQSDRRGSGHAVALLHATDRDRAGVQGTQARLGDPPDLPSTRGPDRGAHLPRLHRLLPARHLEAHGPAVRAGTDAAGHPGEVLHLANGRCPSADRRRAASDVAAPHPAHTRPQTAAGSTQAAIARTAAAAHLGVAPRQDTSQTAPCSADLWRPSTNNQSFMTVLALSCGSRASDGGGSPP